MSLQEDVFGRTGITHGGGMSADATQVYIGGGVSQQGGTGGANSGLLLQQVQVQYSQNVARLYALDTPEVFFVSGRTEGEMQVGQIIGPKPVSLAFFEAYSDVCEVTGTISLQAETGCGTIAGGAMAVNINNPVITSFGLQVTAQDMIVNTQLTLTFVSLGLSST